MRDRRKFIAAVLALAISQAGSGCAAGRGTGGPPVADREITSRVTMALLADPELGDRDIRVATRRGRVRLDGAVASSGEKRRAENLARAVRGAREIDNALRAP